MPNYPHWYVSPMSLGNAYLRLKYELADGTVPAQSLPHSIRNTIQNRILCRHLLALQRQGDTPTPEDVSKLFGRDILINPATNTTYAPHIRPPFDSYPASRMHDGGTSETYQTELFSLSESTE